MANKKKSVVKKSGRDIFAENREGFAALADEQAGKIKLTRHCVEMRPHPRSRPR